MGWNEHPTEVVAGHHARAVARILRDKYGHEVVVEKFPVGETNYGIVRGKSPEAAVRSLDMHLVFDSNEQARRMGNKHGAFAFNFHCTPWLAFGRARDIPADQFKLTERQWDPFGDQNEAHEAKTHEIIFLQDNQRQSYVVEMPAFYEYIPGKTGKKQTERTRAVKAAAVANKSITGEFKRARLIHSLRSGYHEFRTPLHHPEQAKYKNASISEKIAAYINQKIKSKQWEKEPFYEV